VESCGLDAAGLAALYRRRFSLTSSWGMLPFLALGALGLANLAAAMGGRAQGRQEDRSESKQHPSGAHLRVTYMERNIERKVVRVATYSASTYGRRPGRGDH
jgi:hypothetical protein